MKDVHFSSESNEWETPEKLFDQLNKLYGPFDLDPCATNKNFKCDKYYTKEDDGLTKTWFGKVFMNPPYGNQISKWIEKAYNESLRGIEIVCLIPARTDTSYFHKFCLRYGTIIFLKGRIKFKNRNFKINSAPFPSMIVIFPKIEIKENPKFYQLTLKDLS